MRRAIRHGIEELGDRAVFVTLAAVASIAAARPDLRGRVKK